MTRPAGCGPKPRHERLEVDALEVLHGVVEDPVRRTAVVVDGDGVRVAEERSRLHFARETGEVVATGALRRQQLHGRRPPQHRVTGPVHDTHSALAELLLESVLPETLRLANAPAQAEDDRGGQRRQRHRAQDPQDGGHEERDESRRLQHRHRDLQVAREHEQGQSGQSADAQRPARAARHDHRTRQKDRDDDEQAPEPRAGPGARLRERQHGERAGRDDEEDLGGVEHCDRAAAGAEDEPRRDVEDLGAEVAEEEEALPGGQRTEDDLGGDDRQRRAAQDEEAGLAEEADRREERQTLLEESASLLGREIDRTGRKGSGAGPRRGQHPA